MNHAQLVELRCQACDGGTLASAAVRTAFWNGDDLVVVEGIPALVCESCGERYYDDATTLRLDLLRGNGFPSERALYTMEVPVFDFGDVLPTRSRP